MDSESPFRRQRSGFTLVELLIVVGVLALLTGLLLSAFSAVRRSADKLKCMASLQEIGRAFIMYANDNRGYWPMAVHQWTAAAAPTTREKRWNHFISKYVGPSLNDEGDDKSAESRIKNTNTVLWGCPTWNRVAWNTATSFSYDTDTNNGYAMNLYAFAPDTTAIIGNSYANWVYRSVPWTAGSNSANGWYYRASQWTCPADRALVFDSVNTVCAVGSAWPWWTPVTAPMPAVANALTFTPDFNRHAKTSRGNDASVAAINTLFCDGHVATLSARESFQSIRFK